MLGRIDLGRESFPAKALGSKNFQSKLKEIFGNFPDINVEASHGKFFYSFSWNAFQAQENFPITRSGDERKILILSPIKSQETIVWKVVYKYLSNSLLILHKTNTEIPLNQKGIKRPITTIFLQAF